MSNLKHFKTHDEVMSFVESELLATLRDDLDRMEGNEAHHYTDEDREELRNKIADIETVFAAAAAAKP